VAVDVDLEMSMRRWRWWGRRCEVVHAKREELEPPEHDPLDPGDL
jgi:hypothetical protein